jgi:hydrogenase maturation protease
MNPVLVAGLGNIFHGDDGFGVAVVRYMAAAPRPAGVDVIDFGIRGLDLAYALTGGYRLAILIDTVQRGDAPGTLYLIEPEPADFDADADTDAGEVGLSPHQIDPASVLRLTRVLGGACAQVLLIGCEPATFGDAEEGCVGLSVAVAAAVDRAAAMAGELVGEWLREHPAAATAPSQQSMQPLEQTS